MYSSRLGASPIRTALVLALATATAKATAVVDLALPKFTESPFLNDNRGATEVNGLAASIPEVRTALVLEEGQVVSEYVRGDVDPTIPNQIFSATKSWMSLAIGMMVQDGVLSVDETLGEIFDDESVWANMTEVEFRKAVTLKEMLTMNSGLDNPAPAEEEEEEEEDDNWWGDGGTLGGGTLFHSLQEPLVTDGSKTFTYLAANNILSYIIPQRTNFSTPRAYLAAKVFPSLGISNDELEWWKNADGLEYSYHGLLMTPTQMAKLGQLYLQGGKSSETNQLINEDWVKRSTSLQGGNFFYGYLWWVLLGAMLEQPELGTIACAQGLGRQDICISPLTNRVFVQQRDLKEDANLDDTAGLELISLAMAPGLSFDPNRGGSLINEEEENGTQENSIEEGEAESNSNSISDIVSAAPRQQPLVSVLLGTSIALVGAFKR